MATFHVSPGGSDAAAGTTAATAFATLEAAQAAARLGEGADTIVVEDGVHELRAPITLTAADSGTTITEAAGATAVLDGGGEAMALIHVDGASDITISGLAFQNTSGGGDFDSSLAAVRVENGASNITVTDSDFVNVALGVQSYWGANHVTVSDSRFTDTWGPAIDFNDESFQNTATGNTILRSGAVYTEGGAIQMYESWGNTISHNSIKDIPRHGIEEQSWDADNRSGGNLIEYNRITNYMGATEDGGAIYLFGGDDPFEPIRTTIQYNRIEGTADPFSWGIYMDDLVNGANVIGNWVDGGGVANIMVHGGDLNEVANNVLLNGGQYGITVQSGLVAPGPIRLDNIHHNIVAPGTGVWGASDAAPQQWHDNIYVGTEGQFGWNYEPFEVWQEAGGDQGTVVLDSLPGGIGDPDNPIDGPILPPDFPDFPNFNPDWDPILGRPDPVPPDPEEPPPGEVGTDTLVLQLAAQYIGQQPQFIVSVDGAEVGSGMVATRYGSDNQSFSFEGDWGAGAHEVALQFTNDNPIRNLWVEDAYYNGAAIALGGDVSVGEQPGDRLTFTVGQ